MIPSKLVDRIANSSFVIGLCSAAGVAALSGNAMSGNVVVIAALCSFTIMCALEIRARRQT